MSLPRNALYQNNIETSYARNYTNNISPQNGQTYGVGETIIINIPTGRNLVMSGADSVLKFNLTASNSGGAVAEFLRLNKSVHSLFSRVRCFHGSTLISDIDNYGNLVSMMMSLQQSGDSTHGKQNVLAGCESKSWVNTTNAVVDSLSLTGEKLNGIVALADAGTTTERTYTIPIMNFLSTSEKYIPLFQMTGAPLRIELQIVSNGLQAINASRAMGAIPLQLTKVEYVCNFMELSDSGMQIIENSLQGQPLKWVVQDFRNYSHTANVAPDAELSVPVPSKFNSLRSLFTSFRQYSAGTATYFSMDSNHFGLDSYTLRLGSKSIPTKAPNSVAEFFTECMRAIGSVSDLNHEPSINMASYNMKDPVANTETGILTKATSFGSSFYVGVDLESYSSSGLTDVYQGYNSSTEDIYLNLKYSGDASTVNSVKIDTYALYDQVIVIEDGFCNIQY